MNSLRNENFIIKQVEYGSDAYKKTLQFRYEILRKPLGLEWSEKDLENEEKQIHIAAILDEKIVGTVVLKPISEERVKLRQMAVSEDLQGQGAGKKLVIFAEEIAKEKGYKTIEMIARISALGFYEKLGYKTEGEEFEEVTVRSINMIKIF